MKVSFKSIYAIPYNYSQNPSKESYLDFTVDTVNLRKEGLKYNPDKEIAYVYIHDENDKKFENYALRYGIQCRKAKEKEYRRALTILSEADFNNALNSSSQTEAQEDLNFLRNAIIMGVKHKTENNGRTNNITLFEEDGKKIYAQYIVQCEEDNRKKLIEKTEYINGEKNIVKKYDDNGKCNWQKVLCYNKLNIEFVCDKNGEWILNNYSP